MEAKDFLEKNGFKQDSNGTFINGICAVRKSDYNYCIGTYENDFGEEGFMFSQDLNIYWLIGVLTYYGLIDKNYIQ
jgi:hypothetical protein